MTAMCLLFLALWMPQAAAETPDDEPYVVVLNNNQIMRVKQPPLFDGRLAHLVLLDGRRTTMPTKMIDQRKTLDKNRQLAMQRQAEAFAAEQQAAEEAQNPPEKEEPKEPKKIVLTSSAELPDYSRSDNNIAREEVPQEEAAEGEEATPGLLPKESITRAHASDDPVYVSEEVITSTDTGYQIKCTLAVNEPTGVADVQLRMTVKLEDGQTIERQQRTVPNKINYGETNVITFDLQTDRRIQSINYTLASSVLKKN
ncbi:hypothetical protein SCOR_29445 [Sulfidibacter corallicola]|uniref:Uncharacterized protein n=1 Tax=Sulfidibacter corallicola TaxID=2818388 RepID=A0A8A4TN19_SULCO|nr:hypothetical protein [Sulfidibacter corallicola]QTD50318.1 hypothetical protein J3U87_32440 [Sulfidibacter corallicola]